MGAFYFSGRSFSSLPHYTGVCSIVPVSLSELRAKETKRDEI